MNHISNEKIIVLDFGSQYTQLIARRVRELNVYSQIFPFNAPVSDYFDDSVRGVILSGGPASVLNDSSPKLPKSFFEKSVPILGICYGMQLIAYNYGAALSSAEVREYGKSLFTPLKPRGLFKGVVDKSIVWMSHGDHIDTLPEGFEKLGSTDTLDIAAIGNARAQVYGIQFHPEVVHTEYGGQVMENFVYDICGCKGDWTSRRFVETTVSELHTQIDEGDKIILGYSGGVDSTLVTALLLKTFDREQVVPIFINNGLLRKDEAGQVKEKFKATFGFYPVYVDASTEFLTQLAGVVDPERKRKIIGKTFIDVFTAEAGSYKDARYLAQGTLYPDIIESRSYFGGPSDKIKSHHNVGGLPDKLDFELVEPLKELFKDEVRAVCDELGIPQELSRRHPFPGPGLAVRIIGEITPERLEVLREADAIFISALKESGYYDKVWQAFCVLLPVRSVGVMGDERTYENVVAVRAVTSKDGMTADWARLPHDLLRDISSNIINKVKGINRVTYDISSKPPSTIEWE